MGVKLKFNVKDKRVVEILDTGEIDILALYRSIREWEASVDGIVFDEILNFSGSIELPDGTKTPKTLIFVNDWKLAAKGDISIVGGYITARDRHNKYVNPITSESRFSISVLSNPDDETFFVPTSAQKQYAVEQGNLFATDWEIVTNPKPEIRRKANSSKQIHSIFGLYWFLKLEWLKNKDASKFKFPIKGDNQIPRGNIIRHYELISPWSINPRDLEFLNNGPLIMNGEIIVSAEKKESEVGTTIKKREKSSKWKSYRFSNLFNKVTSIFKKDSSTNGQNQITDRKSVTIGIVTALPKEFANMSEQLDNKFEYAGEVGRLSIAYTIGSIPAYGSGEHIIALTKCDMGNNSAGITANQLQIEFPNIQEIIMVGIAGAVPNPTDAETHVRLGDIVVSGKDGVVQYDMVKEYSDTQKEPRHQPRPPSVQLSRSASLLESEYIKGIRPWMSALTRTENIVGTNRPSDEKDILGSTEDSKINIDHPFDNQRIKGEPRVFIGTIGAANILQKNAKQRDLLRGNYGVRALEMESSGISDAAHFSGSSYFVVRGTCDYCDENKNNIWQLYASAIAASYCRALLEKTPIYKTLV